ncbi:MAG: hypothetical protein RL653_2341 [Pseudomonadota bacterium]|jgi:hypothetical protein
MKRSSLLLSFSLLLAGCGQAAAPESDVEACEHLQEGPAVAVTAAATADAVAPSVSEPHKRYDVALVSVSGGKGGSVSFASSDQGHHVLYLSTDVPVEVRDGSGAVVAFESTATSISSCGEVKSKRELELGVGTYRITFGPTPTASVSLVMEYAGEGHAH